MDVYKGSQQVVTNLNTIIWYENLNIRPYKTFIELLEHGFNPEEWETSLKNNGNKIFIEGVPFREYKLEK